MIFSQKSYTHLNLETSFPHAEKDDVMGMRPDKQASRFDPQANPDPKQEVSGSTTALNAKRKQPPFGDCFFLVEIQKMNAIRLSVEEIVRKEWIEN